MQKIWRTEIEGGSMKILLVTYTLVFVFFVGVISSTPIAAQTTPLAELDFDGAKVAAFYNELTVRETVPGTLFTACGFSQGRLGVQELVAGGKTVVFSVSQNLKSKLVEPTAESRQVRVVRVGKGVRQLPRSGKDAIEFSYELNWETGEPLRFVVYAKSEDSKTLYSAYCYLRCENRWQHLATCSTASDGQLLSGLHSFIGGVSADGIEEQKQRSCDIGPPWMLVQEQWEPAVKADFRAHLKTAKDPVAGINRGQFFLRTGSRSERTEAVENASLQLVATERKPPLDLPTAMGDGEMGRRSFRILAYNIKHGRGNDNKVDLERTAEVIRRLNPDFVALQEVDHLVQRSGGVDQARKLALLTGLQHHAFGSFFDYQEGQYGMAVLSRNPIVQVENLRLPDGSEPRTSLVVDVKLGPKKQLKIADVHFYRTEQERLAQARRLLDFLAVEQHDIVILGDFNSKPKSSIIELFRADWEIPDKGEDHFTFRSDRPEVEIDYALIHKDSTWSVSEIDVIEEPVVSDHRPLVFEIVEDQ
jgi:endonuclease/exonuclease/phosphatase family metal-dependent hydrolase